MECQWCNVVIAKLGHILHVQGMRRKEVETIDACFVGGRRGSEMGGVDLFRRGEERNILS